MDFRRNFQLLAMLGMLQTSDSLEIPIVPRSPPKRKNKELEALCSQRGGHGFLKSRAKKARCFFITFFKIFFNFKKSIFEKDFEKSQKNPYRHL